MQTQKRPAQQRQPQVGSPELRQGIDSADRQKRQQNEAGQGKPVRRDHQGRRGTEFHENRPEGDGQNPR